MPPNTSKTYGDFAIVASSNSALHGFGKLAVNSDVELNNSSATQNIKTITQPLVISSAQSLTVNNTSGNIGITSAQDFSAASNISGSTTIQGGSTGMTVQSVNGGNVEITSAQQLNQTSGSTTTITSASGTTISATTGPVDATSTAGNLTALALVGESRLDAPVVKVADTLATTSAQFGNNACPSTSVLGQQIVVGESTSTTTVPGNLVVSGTTTSVNTVNTTITDNLIVLNEAPSALGKDSGIIMSRFSTDVAVGVADSTDTLSADALAGATTLSLTTGGVYDGWYVKIGSEVVRITATSGNDVTISPALASGYTSGQALELFDKSNVAFIWDESAAQFRCMFTPNLAQGTNVADPSLYADLHVKKLICEEGVASSGFATAQVSVVDNASTHTQIVGLKTRGSYQLIIESEALDGACLTAFVSKSSASDSDGAIFQMTSTQAVTGQDQAISVKWLAGEAPSVYHSTLKTGGTGANILYNIRYMTT